MKTENGLGAASFETAFLKCRNARWDECDELGHVNNAVYVQWIQDVATDHWFTVAKGPMAEDHVWVCLRHEIDYREPILPGDAVEVRTWLGKRAGPRFDRYTDIRKPETVKGSVKALTTWVMIDKASGKPRRVGDDVLEAFGLDPAIHT